MNVSTSYNDGVANVLAGPTGQLTSNQALSDYLADAILYRRERQRLMDRRADANYGEGGGGSSVPRPTYSGGGGARKGSNNAQWGGIPIFTKELTGFNLHGTVKADPWERGAAFAGYAPPGYSKKV
jgi:hypothetical protein